MHRVPGDRHDRCGRPALFHLGRKKHQILSADPVRIASLTGIPIGLSACEGAISALDPAGPVGRDFNMLWLILGTGAGLLFMFVIAIAAIAVVPRERKLPLPEGWLLGGLGIAFPAAVLGALLIYTIVLGKEVRESPAYTIRAYGTQHEWIFAYPDIDDGARTVDVVHMPAGVPVAFEVTGLDVIHSFWIPSLGGKIDAVPGRVNRIVLQAEGPGRLGGLCAEYCGVGHARMRFDVVVHDEAAFRAAILAPAEGATPE
jgi:heme/copper-type cytochrome/quinol oxidase subunit 2